jgi:hypothetical protein
MRPIGAAFDSRRRQRETIDAVVDDYVRRIQQAVERR